MRSAKSNKSCLNTLEGHLEHIAYFNADTHYTVAKLITSPSQHPVTIVGFMAGLIPGEALKIRGQWETHRKYGQQFRIQSFEVKLPATIAGIRKYLESGFIKGIGPSMAGRLVRAFGAKTFEIIEKQPERLLEIDGIGETKAAMICGAWKEHHVVRDLMQFLQEMGVDSSFGAKIYKKYGSKAVNIIRENPYCLAYGLTDDGFFVADCVGQHLGVAKEDPERVRAAVIHMLLKSAEDGHTLAEEENLTTRCENLLQLDRKTIRSAIGELCTAKLIVTEAFADDAETRAIYLKDLHAAETGLANRLKALMSIPMDSTEIGADKISKEVQKKLAIKLSFEQLEVLKKLFSHRVAIITGGPGTGKTTLLRSIAIIFEALGKKVQLAAPTGRAARRLAEITGRNTATIHRLLGYNFVDDGFIRNQDNPLDADAVIIDEASMVDTELMNHLVRAVPMSAELILVGDVFQLPSVGPGNVLSDLIHSGCIPVFYLNEIFRQNQESAIVVNAHRVRRGEFPEFESFNRFDGPSDFYFLEQNNPHQVVTTIVKLCSLDLPQRFDFDPINDIQVLTPMHKGVIGTINLNQVLQKALNPSPDAIESMGNAFKLGDKIMHLKNNYQKDVYNGDIGTIQRIDRKKGEISVDYYGRTVNYDHTEMDEISIAYAISVHKSQGSEYPAVIVPMMTQHFVLLQRNLLYTAMTRGQKLVILIGTQKALTLALKNDRPQKRLTRLADRIRGISEIK